MAKRAAESLEGASGQGIEVAHVGDPPEKPKLVAKPPPDPLGPVELSALYLSHPFGINQTATVIVKEARLEMGAGARVGGLVERIVAHPNGAIIVHVRPGATRGMLQAEREKNELQYLYFREGHGEVCR